MFRHFLAISGSVNARKRFRLNIAINLKELFDSTDLKAFGESQRKVKKTGAEKHRIWRKLHLASGVDTHEVERTEATFLDVGDSEV